MTSCWTPDKASSYSRTLLLDSASWCRLLASNSVSWKRDKIDKLKNPRKNDRFRNSKKVLSVSKTSRVLLRSCRSPNQRHTTTTKRREGSASRRALWFVKRPRRPRKKKSPFLTFLVPSIYFYHYLWYGSLPAFSS